MDVVVMVLVLGQSQTRYEDAYHTCSSSLCKIRTFLTYYFCFSTRKQQQCLWSANVALLLLQS